MLRTLGFITGLLVIFLTACSPRPYYLLKDEDSDPKLLELKSHFLSCKSERVMAPTIGVNGHEPVIRVALHPAGVPGSDRLIVFLHGAFSDHNAFRFVAGDLGRDHELLLVDLPGCGESDAPNPENLDETAYSPEDLASRTLQAVRIYLRSRAATPPKLTIVSHSLGGTVVLRGFTDPLLRAEFVDVLSLVDRMVMFSPLDPSAQRPDPSLLELARVGRWRIILAHYLGTLSDRASKATQNAFNDPTQALRQEADKRIEVMETGPRRRALQAMLRRAIPIDDEGRMLWDKIEAIVSGHRDLNVPTLIVWGARDEVLPASGGYKLISELPQARLIILPNVKHSPFIEVPEQAAELIRTFNQQGK
jgi:pimeloyl-ACP methyl ester carboxylesterase